MASREPKYSKEEFERRGEQLFEQEIRSKLTGEDARKFVAIDIESGDFEVAEDSLAATERLLARRPDAQIWMRRVGAKVVHRLGTTRRDDL